MTVIDLIAKAGLAYLGPVLLLMALGATIGRRFGPLAGRSGAALGAVAALVPVAGLPIAGYLATTVGNVAVPTLLLLGVAAVGPVGRRPLIGDADRKFLLFGGGLAALVLLAATYGPMPVELYRAGYADRPLAWGLLPILALCWVVGLRVSAVTLLAAVGLWQYGALPSSNLWDYLVDVPLLIAAAAAGLAAFLGFLAKRRA